MTDRLFSAALLAIALCSGACGRGARSTGGATAVAASPEAMRVGCADGQREGFVDVEAYPRIAGCSGGWSTPGIMSFNPGEPPECPGVKTHDTTRWTCGGAGDDSERPAGEGCTVADLCAPGWHVCDGAAEVTKSSRDGCRGATRPGDPPLFFVTRQSSTGCVYCATGGREDARCGANTCAAGCRQTAATSNDVFGCGNFGLAVTNPACAPLDRFSNDKCNALPQSPWSCDLPGPEDDKGVCEAYTVTKRGSSHGGVLCCKDEGSAPPPSSPPRPAFGCDRARAAPDRLPQADGALHRIAVEGVAPSSPGGRVSFAIVSIQQDEPIEGEHHGADAKGIGEAAASVRAKSLPGNGRVYHIVFRATDASGASCVGEVKVCVPASGGLDCQDDGARFDSTEER